MTATLRIQVLFHWDSAPARELAGRIYRAFSVRQMGDGPRIPVRFGPRQADGGAPPVSITAEREIIVILADQRMAQRVWERDAPVADSWAKLALDLLRDHPPVAGNPHRVLPVALDAGGLQLSPDLDVRSFVRLDVREGAEKERHLILHIATRALRALQDLPQAPPAATDDLPDIPVTLFISHAKRDLSPGLAQGPVKAILATLAQVPVNAWYDSKEIPAGGRFADEIESGVLKSSALIVVLTDAYSSREWCRREILEAKLAARPMVLVDAIEGRVVRLFPYVGNAMTMRWRAALVGSEVAGDPWSQYRAAWEAEDAALVIEAALLEALRYQHEHRRLLAYVKPDEVALGTPPEALTLAHLPGNVKRVWYPDPPLGREELERLRPAAANEQRPAPQLTTPLSELARWKCPEALKTIGVSLSNAPDSDAYGGSPEHLAAFADDLVLYLLVAGLRVAYGGVLGHDALQKGAGDDGVNYVERLLAMVRSHSTLLYDATGRKTAPIENWVAWPIHKRFGRAELSVYGREAVIKDQPRPPDLDVTEAELKAQPNGFVPTDEPAQRYAWARSLTYMREQMGAAISARVAMGGKLKGYQGLWPGVLEEGLVALRARQPLYLLGMFGGAARLLIDALGGVPRVELTSAWLDSLTDAKALRDEYRRRGHEVQTPEALAAELREIGKPGLAAALNNGLTDAENLELTASDDPQHIVELILRGLRCKFAGAADKGP